MKRPLAESSLTTPSPAYNPWKLGGLDALWASSSGEINAEIEKAAGQDAGR
ncbi:MAG: hypothetical protein KF693_00370 [Nitrospira sp.]|nr:hypothetical protein [Nitrospira sp.]